jgi:hypothetical protein
MLILRYLDRMRPVYVVEKVFATFGVFSLIYTITEYYILPYMPVPGESLLKAYMELAVPMIVNYLLYVLNVPVSQQCTYLRLLILLRAGSFSKSSCPRVLALNLTVIPLLAVS